MAELVELHARTAESCALCQVFCVRFLLLIVYYEGCMGMRITSAVVEKNNTVVL